MTHPAWPCAGIQELLWNVPSCAWSLKTSVDVWGLSPKVACKITQILVFFLGRYFGALEYDSMLNFKTQGREQSGHCWLGPLPWAYHPGNFLCGNSKPLRKASATILTGFHILLAPYIMAFVTYELLHFYKILPNYQLVSIQCPQYNCTKLTALSKAEAEP